MILGRCEMILPSDFLIYFWKKVVGPYLNWHFKFWHVPYIPPLSPIYYHRVELNFYLKKLQFKVEYLDHL